MRVSLIAAVSDNGVIGREGDLPWHIPEDLKFFKTTTMGKPIIMGRRTYDSIGKPLPGRRNIVVTRSAQWHAEGVDIVHSLEEAFEVARTVGTAEAMVIGGAEIYKAALPHADRIYLTRVHVALEGDAFFPPVDMSDWTETGYCPRSDADAAYDYEFVTLERTRPGAA